MTLKIAHLFPDILNLYGENGNIKALTYNLTKRKIDYEIINLTLEDEINFKDYDFVYIGSGRKQFLAKAKEKLEPLRRDILDYINKDKVFLITGNAISIFDFLSLYEIDKQDKYIVGNVSATTALCNSKIMAFQNTEYLIKSTSNLIFNLETGRGNDQTMLEGYQKNNFYATSLIGPLLARNIKLTEYFIDLLIENNKDL